VCHVCEVVCVMYVRWCVSYIVCVCVCVGVGVGCVYVCVCVCVCVSCMVCVTHIKIHDACVVYLKINLKTIYLKIHNM